MTTIASLLNSQPFIALFLVIGLGYFLGTITVYGFSLGVGAILFVGLAVGAIAPDSAPPGLMGLIGLILFLYGIGIQYGRNFFAGLASPLGIKANLLALVAVFLSFFTAIWMAKLLGFSHLFGAGVFAGSLTSTATLHAAMEASGSRDPAVGYAIAYPFGVFGPILCFYLASILMKPKIDVPASKRLVTGEIRAGDRGLDGSAVGDIIKQASQHNVDLITLRRDGVNFLPSPEMTLKTDDRLLVAGLSDDIAALHLESEEIVRGDAHDLDYVRVFVSKNSFVGKAISEISLPEGTNARIVQVRRGDNDLLAKPDLTIEYGDQVGVLVDASKRAQISSFFGDSVKAEASFCFMSLSVGMVAGGLIGLIPIPIPGFATISFGIAGGTLILSLVLGYLGRWGPFDWHLPISANLILRNFGLAVFLASVGISSGAPFVANVAGAGLGLFLGGVAVLLATVVPILIIGYYILRMQFDDLLGIGSGATGNPAILAYGNQIAPTGRPDIGYAMIFPGVGTIVKIILVQIIVAM